METSTISIRRMRSTDIAAVQELFQEIDRVHQELLPEEFARYTDEPRNPSFIAILLNDPSRRVFLATNDEDVIGMTIAKLTEPSSFKIFRPKTTVQVSDFVVLPEYRKQGIGERLMNQVENWARTRNADAIQLTVYNQNSEALDYYRHHQFKPLKTTLEKPLD